MDDSSNTDQPGPGDPGYGSRLLRDRILELEQESLKQSWKIFYENPNTYTTSDAHTPLQPILNPVTFTPTRQKVTLWQSLKALLQLIALVLVIVAIIFLTASFGIHHSAGETFYRSFIHAFSDLAKCIAITFNYFSNYFSG